MFSSNSTASFWIFTSHSEKSSPRTSIGACSCSSYVSWVIVLLFFLRRCRILLYWVPRSVGGIPNWRLLNAFIGDALSALVTASNFAISSLSRALHRYQLSFDNHLYAQHTTFCHTDFFKLLSVLQVLTDISKDHWLWTIVHDECQIASKGYRYHPQSHQPCTYKFFISCRSRPSKADSSCISFFCDDVPKQVGKCTIILLAMSLILGFLPIVLSVSLPLASQKADSFLFHLESVALQCNWSSR